MNFSLGVTVPKNAAVMLTIFLSLLAGCDKDPKARAEREAAIALENIERQFHLITERKRVEAGGNAAANEAAYRIDVVNDLMSELRHLPDSTKAADMRTKMHRALVEETKMLLTIAKEHGDRQAMEEFLESMRNLDMNDRPERFGITHEELRKLEDALVR